MHKYFFFETATGTVVIKQSSSPLTALAQRYGFTPYSLFTATLFRQRHPADMIAQRER